MTLREYGKVLTVRPEVLDGSSVIPDAVLSSIAHVPDWIDRSL